MDEPSFLVPLWNMQNMGFAGVIHFKKEGAKFRSTVTDIEMNEVDVVGVDPESGILVISKDREHEFYIPFGDTDLRVQNNTLEFFGAEENYSSDMTGFKGMGQIKPLMFSQNSEVMVYRGTDNPDKLKMLDLRKKKISTINSDSRAFVLDSHHVAFTRGEMGGNMFLTTVRKEINRARAHGHQNLNTGTTDWWSIILKHDQNMIVNGFREDNKLILFVRKKKPAIDKVVYVSLQPGRVFVVPELRAGPLLVFYVLHATKETFEVYEVHDVETLKDKSFLEPSFSYPGFNVFSIVQFPHFEYGVQATVEKGKVLSRYHAASLEYVGLQDTTEKEMKAIDVRLNSFVNSIPILSFREKLGSFLLSRVGQYGNGETVFNFKRAVATMIENNPEATKNFFGFLMDVSIREELKKEPDRRLYDYERRMASRKKGDASQKKYFVNTKGEPVVFENQPDKITYTIRTMEDGRLVEEQKTVPVKEVLDRLPTIDSS